MTNRTSPLGDGQGGAGGNANDAPKQPALSGPRQQHGAGYNPASVPAGGPVLKLDPPSDRQGQIGTTADPRQRRPFTFARDGVGEGSAYDAGAAFDANPGTVGAIPVDEDTEEG